MHSSIRVIKTIKTRLRECNINYQEKEEQKKELKLSRRKQRFYKRVEYVESIV